ncbi:MAG: zinc-binding dehydrogenase, partial [Polyangiaceae bacterium]
AVVEALGGELVDYRREDVAARVRQLAPAGVNAVFDHVGGASLKLSYGLLAQRGTLVSYGSASTRDEHGSAWAPIVRHTLWALWMNLRPGERRVRMFDVWGRTELSLGRAAFQARFRADLSAVLALVERGQLAVTIAASFPLERAGDALRLHESGTTSGKILLEPGSAPRV